jgi:hypothetical protein
MSFDFLREKKEGVLFRLVTHENAMACGTEFLAMNNY